MRDQATTTNANERYHGVVNASIEHTHPQIPEWIEAQIRFIGTASMKIGAVDRGCFRIPTVEFLQNKPHGTLIAGLFRDARCSNISPPHGPFSKKLTSHLGAVLSAD